MAQPKKFNKSINGLRGVAAFTVMLFHTLYIHTEYKMLGIPFETVGFRRLGEFFVAVFFCISGYLIIGTLASHNNVGRFAKNRVARIYPMYLISTGLVVLFSIGKPSSEVYHMVFTDPHRVLNIVGNLFFLSGVFHIPTINPVAWSLSFEAAFYVLAASAFTAMAIPNQYVKWATYACVSIASAAVIFLGAINAIFAIFFLIGIATYQLQEVRHKFLAGSSLVLSLVISISIIASYICFSLDRWYPFTVLLAFAFMFYPFGQVCAESSFLSRFLQSQVLQFLGAISYSLYLVHTLVIRVVSFEFGRHFAHLHGSNAFLIVNVASYLACIGISIGLATITYQLIEVRLTKALFGRKPGTPQPSPV